MPKLKTRAIMSIVDVDVLLQEVEAGMPCGPNLEYDPLFLELEQNALGKPEVQYGKTIVPAVAPEWKVVKKQAFELLGRARELAEGGAPSGALGHGRTALPRRGGGRCRSRPRRPPRATRPR